MPLNCSAEVSLKRNAVAGLPSFANSCLPIFGARIPVEEAVLYHCVEAPNEVDIYERRLREVVSRTGSTRG